MPPRLPGQPRTSTSIAATTVGSTWSNPFNFGQARPPFALIPTADNKKIYFTGKNLLVSADLGTGWSNIPSTADSFHSLAFTGGMLLLGGEKGLTPVALDGNTVRDVAPLPIGQFLAANLDSVNGVWAAGPAGLFGPLSTVVDTHTGGIGPVGGVAAASSGSNILASANDTLQISTDAGAQFAPKTVIADGELRAPFPPVLLDQTVTASAYVAGRRLYHTTNNGNTWTATGDCGSRSDSRCHSARNGDGCTRHVVCSDGLPSGSDADILSGIDIDLALDKRRHHVDAVASGHRLCQPACRRSKADERRVRGGRCFPWRTQCQCGTHSGRPPPFDEQSTVDVHSQQSAGCTE